MKKLSVLVTLALLLVSAGFANNPATGGHNSGQTGGQHTGAFMPATSYAAWEWTTTGIEFTNGNWTFGQVFTPTTNLQVNYLGYFNPTGGMLDSHPVSIWDANGNLIASSTITSASAFSTAHFLYNPISSVTLQAGATYEITGVSGIDNYAYDDVGFTVNAPINYLGYNYCLGCGDVFTGTGTVDLGVGDAFWGPNFGWSANTGTPEPGSLVLLGTGIVGLAGMIRRKLF